MPEPQSAGFPAAPAHGSSAAREPPARGEGQSSLENRFRLPLNLTVCTYALFL